jgi:hypothetical protein
MVIRRNLFEQGHPVKTTLCRCYFPRQFFTFYFMENPLPAASFANYVWFLSACREIADDEGLVAGRHCL